ncbi:methionine/alanine import family NSS transporter small subunit [Nocardioides coralli]|nr:methionine/alanine import family NSS transporter small subunit [Nocardioides coralli]QZY29214.1 methionine/alanine import family NSS transporter small subunit [Nocardioides coralli]
MSATAIVMMLVAMLVIWGGLALAIRNLSRSPDVPTRGELHRDL